MTLFSLWLLAFGITVGVAATLTFQWWKTRARWRSIELDDYTERLRALDNGPYTWSGAVELWGSPNDPNAAGPANPRRIR